MHSAFSDIVFVITSHTSQNSHRSKVPLLLLEIHFLCQLLFSLTTPQPETFTSITPTCLAACHFLSLLGVAEVFFAVLKADPVNIKRRVRLSRGSDINSRAFSRRSLATGDYVEYLLFVGVHPDCNLLAKCTWQVNCDPWHCVDLFTMHAYSRRLCNVHPTKDFARRNVVSALPGSSFSVRT